MGGPRRLSSTPGDPSRLRRPAAWSPIIATLCSTLRSLTLGADGVVDFIKDNIGDQEVVVDGKTVALEDLISAMTARYDSEDNVLRLVAQITFATLRTLVVAGVFG